MKITSTPNHPQRKRKLLWAVGAAFGLAALAWLWLPISVYANFVVPTPRLPQPNGYDLFLKARRQFTPRPRDPRLDGDSENPSLAVTKPSVTSPSATSRWVRDSATAFALFDQAQKAEFVHPPVRAASIDEEEREENRSALRALAWCKSAQSVARSEIGDYSGAVASALDAFELGVKLPRGAPMTAALNGYAIEAVARHRLTKEIAHLNGAQAAAATRRMEQINARRIPFDQTLREEKWAGLFTLQTELNSVVRELRTPDDIWGSFERLGLLFITPRRLASDYIAGMDALTEQAKQPWSQWGSPPATTPVMRPLIVAQHGARFFHVRTQASAHLMLTRLALHAFRKERGLYPVQLRELVPRYLTQVPDDPFVASPLRYQRSGTRYQLWSVGPDLRDDNARPAIDTSATNTQRRYLITKNSIGDMVANISP